MIAANTNSVNANSLGLWIELDAILAAQDHVLERGREDLAAHAERGALEVGLLRGAGERDRVSPAARQRAR